MDWDDDYYPDDDYGLDLDGNVTSCGATESHSQQPPQPRGVRDYQPQLHPQTRGVRDYQPQLHPQTRAGHEGFRGPPRGGGLHPGDLARVRAAGGEPSRPDFDYGHYPRNADSSRSGARSGDRHYYDRLWWSPPYEAPGYRAPLGSRHPEAGWDGYDSPRYVSQRYLGVGGPALHPAPWVIPQQQAYILVLVFIISIFLAVFAGRAFDQWSLRREAKAAAAFRE